MATRMYSFPLDGVIKSVTISSVSWAVLIRREWKPDFARPPPSLGPPSICPRVYFVCMTRFDIRAAYYTGFILSSSSGKYFTGIPKQRKLLISLCDFKGTSLTIEVNNNISNCAWEGHQIIEVLCNFSFICSLKKKQVSWKFSLFQIPQSPQ